MSRDLLQAIGERSVLRPRVAYSGLAEVHVDLDRLNSSGGPFEEGLVTAGHLESGCTVVLGEIGGGKSSLIAAAAERLEPERFIVRVRGLGQREELTREDFAHHLGEETLDALERAESGPGRRKLKSAKEKLANSLSRSTGGHGLGYRGSQVKVAAQELTRQQQPTQILSAAEELVAVAADVDRPLLVVVEDTDSLWPPTVREAEDDRRAETFIAEILRYLARELACPSFVAVHARYRTHLNDLPVESIEIPAFSDPTGALDAIIEQYLRAAGIHAAAADLLEREALAFLAETMSKDGNVRNALHAVNDAVLKALKEDSAAERVTLAVARSTTTS